MAVPDAGRVLSKTFVGLPSCDQVRARGEELDQALDQVGVVDGGAEFGGHGTPR